MITDQMVEKACRAMLAESRPNLNPDELTPGSRGTVGLIPKWQMYERLVRPALTAALSDAGWQDISTAPKDGTEIDLWSVSGRRWTRYRWDSDASYPAFTDARYADRHWMDRPILPANLATHWMRAPEGPSLTRHERDTTISAPPCDRVAQRIERSEPDEGRKDVGSNPTPEPGDAA